MNAGSTLRQFYQERDEIILPSLMMIDRLAERSIPLVYFSSGGAIYGCTDEAKLGEDHPCQPISSYGQSKLEIESYIHFATRVSGLRHLIIRPSNPYGMLQSLNGRQGLIAAVFGKLLRNEPLEIWGRGDAVRDYTHVDDLVSATCDVIGLYFWNMTLNIGSGRGHSVLDVIAATERATGLRCAKINKPHRSTDVDRVVLDVSRLVSLGAWYDRSLDTGIRDYARQLGFDNGETTSTRNSGIWQK